MNLFFCGETFFPTWYQTWTKTIVVSLPGTGKKKTLFILHVETWFHLLNRVKIIPFPHREKKNKDKNFFRSIFFSCVEPSEILFFFLFLEKMKKKEKKKKS